LFGGHGGVCEVEMPMKTYLLILLIGMLLTAVHFTAPSQKQRKAAGQ
jgi:hypothetical protein